MTNKNEEIDYSNLTQVLRFSFEQMLKGIYTAIPAKINSYDQQTKRAVVTPAIRLLKTDGEEMSRPPIANVPVLHPSGGGFVMHFPIVRGDAVMLLFSARGLSKFKNTYQVSGPDEGFFDIKDAVAIPGFGALGINPASQSGVSMQTEDGSNAVYVEQGHIRITTPLDVQIDCQDMLVNGDVHIDGSVSWTGDSDGQGGATFQNGVNVSGGDLTHKGKDVGDTHRHDGVAAGSSNSGVPI